jgi:predicted nucleic acid-binding protein
MKIAIDSSGLILLAKADILRETCSIVELETTEEVKNEVMMGLEKGRKDALYLQELVEEEKIKIVPVDKNLVKKFRKDFNLGLGEASVIALAISQKMPMVTDDDKARKIGKILGVSVLSSLDFPSVLYGKNVITYDKAKICLEVLKKEGWFSENVLIEAFKALERVRGEKE